MYPPEVDAAPGRYATRPSMLIGDVWLSVQAGTYYHSSPAVNGKPLSSYKSVDVAILDARTGSPVKPRDLGIPWLPSYDWDTQDFAGYVTHEEVRTLMRFLVTRATNRAKQRLDADPKGAAEELAELEIARRAMDVCGGQDEK